MPFFFCVVRIFLLCALLLAFDARAVLAAVPAKAVKAAATPAAAGAAKEAKAAKPAEPESDAAAAGAAASSAKLGETKSVSVSRVVGEAGPRIVTSREVRMNEAITQILRPEANGETKKRILDIDDPAFPAQVLKVLDEWTVFLEATVIGTKTADKNEVSRLTKVVTETWKGFPDWEKLEASPSEIREIVERKLAARSLEHLKGDASLVNVSDAEALQYFKKNRLRFGNLPFENFKDGIKAALVRSQTERRLTEWRAVLRKKYRVRNFVGA